MSRRRQPLSASPRGGLRFVLALVASFIAVGYLASFVHMALVAHTACAEHGRLVHVQDAPAQRLHDGEPAPSASPSDALVSDEHDHCVAGATSPSDARIARTSPRAVLCDEPAPSLPSSEAPSVRSERVEPPPPIALLLLSPKVSPPVPRRVS